MKLRKQILLFCLIILIKLPLNILLSQNIQTKPTRQSSLEAFSQGNYEKAYTEFRELLLTYTKDPMYKYYSGVCLVKLMKDPSEATDLLKDAVQGTGTVKTLPSDGLFYLGRAQQMSGKFTDAAESYKLYADKVGKKVSREMGVPDLIQQCSQKKGQIADSEIKPVEKLTVSNSEISLTEIMPVTEDPTKKAVPAAIAIKENIPSIYDKILKEAVEFQYKADSVSSVIKWQKTEADKLSGNEKSAMKARILENEKLAASFQNRADQKYREAQIAMNPQQLPASTVNNLPVQSELKVSQDSAKKLEFKPTRTMEVKPDTAKAIHPIVRQPEPYFSLFEVLPHPVTDPKAKIVIDPEVPEGLIYRIQIAVFRNPVTPSFFKGLSPVYGFKIAGTDKTIYYAGMFRKSSDAGKALSIVRAKGFKDAFIVGLSGNRSVSPDRSASMEKEWSKKPLGTGESRLSDNKSDTIPPTLTFRVEVTRSAKPLKEDIVEEIRKISGNKGLDIVTIEDGQTDYLIGKFITFETAAEYSDLLKRNGYRDAHVVSWLGNKEIPIETARQLFDKLK